MKIARIFLNPIIFLSLAVLYLYLLFYTSFNSVKIEKFVDSVNFQVIYDKLDEEAKGFVDYETFKSIISDSFINVLNGNEFDSSKILQIVDSKLAIIINNPNIDESFKQQVRTEAYLKVNSFIQPIEEFSKSESIKTVQIIYEIFSSKTLKSILVVFAVMLIASLIINPKFKWIKYNGVVMAFVTISYFVTLLVLNKILSLAPEADIANIVKSCFNVLFESSFYICIYFMITSILSLCIYKFGLSRIYKKA